MHIFEAFDSNDLEKISLAVERSELFSPGSDTAKGLAKSVKKNKQITEKDNPKLISMIRSRLVANEVFMGLSLAVDIPTLMINRYDEGDFYGVHSDGALQSEKRSDMSFTIFLCKRDSYVGGELVLHGSVGQINIKLEKNQGILYPTSLLHNVNSVEKGVRIAIVGWVRSRVRDTAKRTLLIDLDKVRVSYRDKFKDPKLAMELLKISNDLKRMWFDT